jgi:hypothetical protein
MDLTHAVDLLSIKENPLGDGGLPGIDVGHKPNISGSYQSFLSSHLFFSIFRFACILAILKGFFRNVNPSPPSPPIPRFAFGASPRPEPSTELTLKSRAKGSGELPGLTLSKALGVPEWIKFPWIKFPLTILIGYVLFIRKVRLWKDFLAFTSFIFILTEVTHKANPYFGMKSHG